MSTRGDWYGVRVVVECQVGSDAPGRRTYEDRVIVVRAGSEPDARRKAERLTRRKNESYRNFKGEKVVWRFKDVVDSCMILDDDLVEGTEVYYAFMNYRFYQSLANRFRPGLWQAYLKAHPRADMTKVTVGRVLDWNAKRAPRVVAKVRRLAIAGQTSASRKPTKRRKAGR